jgi:hypothetical protein
MLSRSTQPTARLSRTTGHRLLFQINETKFRFPNTTDIHGQAAERQASPSVRIDPSELANVAFLNCAALFSRSRTSDIGQMSVLANFLGIAAIGGATNFSTTPP